MRSRQTYLIIDGLRHARGVAYITPNRTARLTGFEKEASRCLGICAKLTSGNGVSMTGEIASMDHRQT